MFIWNPIIDHIHHHLHPRPHNHSLHHLEDIVVGEDVDGHVGEDVVDGGGADGGQNASDIRACPPGEDEADRKSEVQGTDRGASGRDVVVLP